MAVAIAVLIMAPSDELPFQAADTRAAIPPSPTSTNPTDPAASFVVSFRVAIDAQDVAFLMERLHPVVIDAYGTDTCRAFVSQEILQMSDYRQIGKAIGPIIRAFATATGSTTTQTYEVPVAFEFQGQRHEERALLGFSGETMHWFAECR